MPKKRKRKANAEPAGGGGGGWAEHNRKMAENRAAVTGQPAEATGTSIFDPVLCELVYRWFCPPGGWVLDPFAGGSVRGIVASKLGRPYLGIDLRQDQVTANYAQSKLICEKPLPDWRVGDAVDLKVNDEFDLVFSCPPYCDLEVYSEDPRDLSTMEHEQFLVGYDSAIRAACAHLRNNRFACFVVGDARGPDGSYYGLPWRTVEYFTAAGLRLYNNAVLVTAAGSLPIRTAKQFTTSRKLGTTHQHVLVFVKGDARKATEAIGEIEFGAVDEAPVATAAVPELVGGEI
jgi:DNA methylase